MERAEAALAQSLNETVGTLRVAAFQTAVLNLVPHALERMQRQHPGLRVEVTELDPEVAVTALVAGEFDIVVGEEYPGHPLPRPRETERTDLLTDELRLVTPATWSERSLAALSSRPFVMEPPGTTAREWATAVCRQAGFEADVRYTTTDLQIHLRLVDAGWRRRSFLICRVRATVPVSLPGGSPVVRGDRSSRPCAVEPPTIPRSLRSPPL
jgi:DNA-binding transcriptional LysR family regulator